MLSATLFYSAVEEQLEEANLHIGMMWNRKHGISWNIMGTSHQPWSAWPGSCLHAQCSCSPVRSSPVTKCLLTIISPNLTGWAHTIFIQHICTFATHLTGIRPCSLEQDIIDNNHLNKHICNRPEIYQRTYIKFHFFTSTINLLTMSNNSHHIFYLYSLRQCIQQNTYNSILWRILRRLIIRTPLQYTSKWHLSSKWGTMLCNLISTSSSHLPCHKQETNTGFRYKGCVEGTSIYTGHGLEMISLVAWSSF